MNTLNVFTYCANNPVIFKDDSGYWVETAWDFFSFGKSLYDVCKNPDDPMAWLGLGLDGLSLLAPGIPALSGSLKVVSYADDVYDAYNAVDTVIDTSKSIDNIVDTTHIINNTSNVLQVASKSAPKDILYTNKVLRQMSNSNDLSHSFPTFIDSYVDLSTGILKPGGDGVVRNFISFPGTINDSYGFFEYIIEPNGMCNHRYFNIVGNFR